MLWIETENGYFGKFGKCQLIEHIVIKPHIGIEGLFLGTSMSEVLDILGKPEKRSFRRFKDISCSSYWNYLKLGLSLTFSSDDDWLLGTINIDSENAKLAGYRFVGLDEKGLLKTVKKAGITPTVLEDDFKELASKDYACDRMGLTFWVQDGKVDSITIFPKYDESGDIPLWPEKKTDNLM